MEKLVEKYVGNNKISRNFQAKLQEVSETVATTKNYTLTHRTRSATLKNYSHSTITRNNENSEQQSKHRQEPTPSQQQYYVRNAATKGTIQQQPQLTPTVDYFRFSALYALVANSATVATYNMRDAYACVTTYDEVNSDGGADDNSGNDYMPHHHSTRQRRIAAMTAIGLSRNHISLTRKSQLSNRVLRAACLRSGTRQQSVISAAAAAAAGGVYSCGLFNTIGTVAGNGTSFAGGGSGLDKRSLFYLTLVFFIYCGAMMRASVAATAIANATHNNNISDSDEDKAPIAATAAVAASLTPIATPIESVMLIDSSVQDSIASTTASTSATLPLPVINLTAAIAHSSPNVSLLAEAEPPPPPPPLHFVVDAFAKDLTYIQRVAKRDTAHVPDDEDDSAYHDDEFDEYEALINNRSAKGKYIGAPCFSDMTCETTLLHVTCDKETKTCGCEKNYPVQLGLTKGCDKPKKLGEQCFYDETCMYNDENSLCVQVRHNAMCQCAHGFHSVSHTKPTRRVFCTKDLKELSSDLPTLLGVSTGIAVLAGLICMVLHLFSKTKYPRPRNFGDANLPPPIMYSSETGIPLTVQSGRPSSRSSLRSSGSIGSYGNRRASSGGATIAGGHGGGHGGGGSSGTKGILVSTSRTGSRRPSLASVHSTSSSVRSYSMMRFEKEAQQKEIRQEMKLRLARLQQQQHLNQNKPQIVIGDTLQHHMGASSALSRLSGMPTPSPLTPNSMDELLPSVDELQEYPPKSDDLATTIHKMAAESVASSKLTAIKQAAVGTSVALTTTMGATTMAAASTGASGSGSGCLVTPGTPSDGAGAAAYIGPCSSSTEAL
ncbi:PREDICTED: uncharacterized protein LOC108368821 [Rhagoletis zephyria]|uniref:uncharacterized protein LOC108368821 n=1 Tax=Rhagoletis zephyria TaxID=28612 RepID=UPI0008112ACA|nr:PREDICTED: uncharacterized protein LOC108368821 [Rhagoletis zephyria]